MPPSTNSGPLAAAITARLSGPIITSGDSYSTRIRADLRQ